MLKFKTIHDNFIGLIVKNVLALVDSFNFCSWSYIKWGGNRVANDLAHWQSFSLSSRIWEVDALDSIVSWASEDMFAYVDSNLI